MSVSDAVSGSILHLVDQFGLAAIFFGLVLDSCMLLPFVPGEILLVVAVQRFAKNFAELLFVVVLCTLGTLVGSLVLFLLSKHGGRNFILKHPRLFMMNPERRDKLERTFRRPVGQSLVMFMRLFPFTRIVVSLPAGLAEMGIIPFTILSSIGLFVFNGALMWFIYESRSANSPIVTYINFTRTNYVDPLYHLALNNLAWVAAGLVVLGILSLLRRAFRMLRNPKVPAHNTLLGTLAVTVLFWGGVILVVGVWTDPILVYEFIARSGYDVVAATDQYFLGPVLATIAIGVAACLVALFFLWILHLFISATERRRRVEKWLTEPQGQPTMPSNEP